MFTTARKGQDPLDAADNGVMERSQANTSSLAPGDRVRRTVSSSRILLPGVSRARSSSSTSSLFKRWSVLGAAGIGETPIPVPTSEFTGPLSKSDGSSSSSRCPPPRMWQSDSFVLDCQVTDEKNAAPRPSSISSANGKSKVSRSRSQHWKSLSSNLNNSVMRRRSSLKWIKETEIYNVASTQIRSMLQPPATSLDLKDVPEGAFAGPLLEIFPESKFPRPSRVDNAEWVEVMGVGKWLYPAEDSGLVTFWQAILVNVHWMRCGIGALLSLTSQDCNAVPNQSKLFDSVTYPMGQLVNAIGLSWEHHHVRNLDKMDEAARQRINIPSLSHRHHNLQSKIWAVLLKLQDLDSLKTQAERIQAVSDAHKKFEEFYVYLIYTIRIIMEDTLFLYRSSLTNEQQMSCLCDTQSLLDSSNADDLIWQAFMLIAGGTATSQWKKRFGYMGHGWLARQTTLKLGLSRYYGMFLNPIKLVLKAAELSKAASPDG